jgi:hypothetical protein
MNPNNLDIHLDTVAMLATCCLAKKSVVFVPKHPLSLLECAQVCNFQFDFDKLMVVLVTRL